mmetsp:Transcript_6131/g.10619  ORF Transcript_6131/g.10619 Transcript_6131/m.10619 type:complete len:332 (-) Transcript_6131:53-1048(-)
MPVPADNRTRLGIAAGVVGAVAVGYYLWRKRQGKLRVARLVIYPVKGCKGIEVKSAKLYAEGLEHDREYIITSKDEAGVWKFSSQRDLPKMALIEPVLPTEDGTLELRAPGMSPIEVGIPAAGAQKVSLEIWGDQAEGLDCGDKAAEWFSKFLEKPGLRLIKHSGTRRIDPKFGTGATRFSDGYPLLITTEASIKDAEKTTGVTHGCERMRPNLVLSGAVAPYAEDLTSGVSCGGRNGEGGAAVRFNFLKPCARCTVPRVDPRTGVPGKDPVAALKPYRSGKVLAQSEAVQKDFFGTKSGQVFFGQNAQPEMAKFFGGVAKISVGDGAKWL